MQSRLDPIILAVKEGAVGKISVTCGESPLVSTTEDSISTASATSSPKQSYSTEASSVVPDSPTTQGSDVGTTSVYRSDNPDISERTEFPTTLTNSDTHRDAHEGAGEGQESGAASEQVKSHF